MTHPDEAPDRLLTATRIAARYAPDRAIEFGARNDAPGETVARLRMARVIGQAKSRRVKRRILLRKESLNRKCRAFRVPA